MNTDIDLNVFGQRLDACNLSTLTGFLRDGECRMPANDVGQHGVCAQMTLDFLEFTRKRGNDLSTPMPEYGFPGLKPGDRWCLCASRWKEALADGVAPPVVLAATHEAVLEIIPLAELKYHTL